MNEETRKLAITIAAAIFATRDLANYKGPQDRGARFATDAAISKAQRLVGIIEHKLRNT